MNYPFTAIVGMDDLALALSLSAVSPAIGGVLVRGEKGTAKSTMVRALTSLLPPVTVVAGCRFSCDPVSPDPACPDGPHADGVSFVTRPARLVELPVGVTEDRVLGSLHLERALREGVTAYDAGLLAAAHRGLLYVDEVNLLADHVVDVLLDAAGMGRVTVEREGVSIGHAARFVLVGTMNPEEGELRPQLLDRFGLTVDAAASRDPRVRAEVVRRRMAYEADPVTFATRYFDSDEDLAGRILAARKLLPDVALGDRALLRVAEVCAAFEVDGMRADLVTARTAIAHAAWSGRTSVTVEDIRVAARLALPHRARRNPFDPPGLDQDRLDQALAAADGDDDPPPDGDGPGGDSPGDGDGSDSNGSDSRDRGSRDRESRDGGSSDSGSGSDAPGNSGPESSGSEDRHAADSRSGDPRAGDARSRDGRSADSAGPAPDLNAPDGARHAAGTPYRPRLLAVPGVGDGAAGRRSRALTGIGRTVRTEPAAGGGTGRVVRPDVLATLLAAAPHQRSRGRSGPGLVVLPSDVRVPVREGRESNLILFCVDASGSMAARQRMREVKTAVLSLLLDAYQRRDKVGLVTFRGAVADLALPPTSSVEAAAARLADLPTGGRTPLAEGLIRAADVLRVERIRDPRRRALLVLVTDGRATAGPRAVPRALTAAAALAPTAAVVLDCESGRIRLGLAGRLAGALGAELIPLSDVAADALTDVVRSRAVGRRAA